MTLDQVIAMCEKALEPSSMAGTPMIIVDMPANKNCPRRRRMFGRYGPMGQVVAWGFDGRDTVLFNARDVLEFINREKPL